MTAIADASDMAVWGWREWVLALAVITATCLVTSALTHTRRVDQGATDVLATRATCTVPTCPNRGDWAVNGTDLCIDHMLVINGRKS